MSVTADDLGVLGNLGKATGLLGSDGDPNPDWFGDPAASLQTILADDGQRAALIGFVDDALGGADPTADASGATWLPLVQLQSPDPRLTVAVTVDDSSADHVTVGLGVAFETDAPTSRTTATVPLFQAAKRGHTVTTPFLLGQNGGRIHLASHVTVDDAAATPGEARLGGIGLQVDLPSAPGDSAAVFGLVLEDFQLPGASSPQTVTISGSGGDEIEHSLLDLVLTLVRAQAQALGSGPLAALAGLLGLAGDQVPDFPIEQLASQGVAALPVWFESILASAAARDAWLGHLAALVGGSVDGDEIALTLGATGAALRLGLQAQPGASGHTQLTASLGVEVGPGSPRVQAQAQLLRLDLGTGAALALPALGLWASIGKHDGAGTAVLDLTAPEVAHADTLRLGFALDASRNLTFVLAADGVQLGTRSYPTLDLTSPDAVMDAAEHAVEDIASELLAQLGGALGAARVLLGLDPPAGQVVPTIELADLLRDPLAAVTGYWRTLLTQHGDAVPALLETVRDTFADAGVAALPIRGSGTADDPWRVALVGPVELEASVAGDTFSLVLAASTSVDTLGQRCTVVETRLAATLASFDLAAGHAQLLTAVEGVLNTRERGVNPPQVTLPLGTAVLTAAGVGFSLRWVAGTGLAAALEAPSLSLQLASGEVLPLTLPTIAADGSVTLPPDAWDALQALLGELGLLLPGLLGTLLELVGWSGDGPGLRLADLVADPAAAIAAWLPELAVGELGPTAVGLLADLLSAAGPVGGAIAGGGSPDDPFRLALDRGGQLPELALWLPPAGLERPATAAPQGLRDWRPGRPPLPADALAAAIAAEATVDAEVDDLADGRDIAGGLSALATRWTGSDGPVVPPATAPDGVAVERVGTAAGALLARLDLEDTLGRTPTTVVHVAVGAGSWPDAPADRLVDLTAAGLAPAMFTAPAAAAGDWFVALGERAACKLADGDVDGTLGQAQRLQVVLDALAPLGNDLALVALAGAGHAARLAAQQQPAFSDLVTLGTPLGPVSLTAVTTQPGADALRLLGRLLPAPTGDGEDDDLALARELVTGMLTLAGHADPASELRLPANALPAPRAGLTVTAVFGALATDQVGRALTAAVAAGLATRARPRAAQPLPEPTGVDAGIHFALPASAVGTLAIDGDALLTLASFDRTSGFSRARVLRARLNVRDRLGWLIATPDTALRKLSLDVTVPLDGAAGHGQTTVTLHDATALGTDQERLTLATGSDLTALLPEARVLIAAAVQRLVADTANPLATQVVTLLQTLGLVAAGGAVPDAFEQLIHDPAGLVAGRLAAARSELATAVAALLGPAGAGIDLADGRLTVSGGSPTSGLYGWTGELQVSAAGIGGQLAIGPSGPAGPAGALQLVVDLGPFAVGLRWRQPSGSVEQIALWPDPQGAALARALAQAGPSLAGQLALELMRGADEDARPLIDAALDALGMLGGSPADQLRPLRPLAGFLADPAGWLRSSQSIGSQPAKAQALFDALRPLTGLGGSPGDPLPLASGVALAVQADGPDLALALGLDSSGWAPLDTPLGRLATGVTAGLTVGATGNPRAALELQAGLGGAPAGRSAVHVRLGTSGIEVFLRPGSGPDISLVPFAGLGSLAAAAERALPFLLDQLAGVAGPVGEVVAGLGDALALRVDTPAPRHFDYNRLSLWASDPVAALANAVPSIVATGLETLAPLLAGVVPAAVSVNATATDLTLTVGAVSLGWNPSGHRVSVGSDGIAVPGIDELSFALAVSDSGLEELSLGVGPAAIDAGAATLQPFASFAVGASPAGGRRVAVGLAVDDTHRFAARWLLDGGGFAFAASDGPLASPTDQTDPGAVALRAVETVADLVASVALGTDAVQQLLDRSAGGGHVRDLLRGVLLEDVPNPTGLVGGLFDPATVLARIQHLLSNLAGIGLTVTVDGLDLSLTTVDGVIGMQLGLVQRMALVSGDVSVWLENDGSWIENPPAGPGGIFVGVLRPGGVPQFEPSIAVDGVGLRIGKQSGPLLDFGITLESVALHTYAELTLAGAKAGGMQLQLTNLAVAASGASGGNGIASGLLKDSGSQPPKPAFSPALAIQKHDTDDVHVTLRAGDGDGPWWIAIQKGFGPIYLEQVGFGVTMPQQRVERISLLLDGSVSLFGLTCAVDDLEITYLVSNGDFFNAANWSVDLAGLAVDASMAGVTIAGGLLKSGSEPDIQYLGMLLGRFAVYGITIFGGYGQGEDQGQRFVAFFAVGAVVGPIGGPPAFFLTGIGGGFAINRALVVPTDLSTFGQYPLIQALDVAAQPGNPMDELQALGQYFPMRRGTFWFAAGISFNSFALVDGIAVVAVEIGDGLDISLLGLARMALPRPQLALVSIEIALIVRFSSSEGVLWVQGQLTDNSWLLYPDVRLTGGFAFVTWFKGDYRGQFVLTLGGYHPSFNKPGYPQVPRLGLRWSIGDAIVIEAGSYFALTSEAVMAGGDFKASADFGPAWAKVAFGAHGIIFFDPFHYDVMAYARIAAGVTIDTWVFGTITISVSLGAQIEVQGPNFHGRAEFDVGPVSLSVEFGDSDQGQPLLLDAATFIGKYLSEASPGVAAALTVITSSGAQPSGGNAPTPDGGADRPLLVTPEFALVLTTIVPATDLTLHSPAGDSSGHFAPTRQLGVAPMGAGSVAPSLELSWVRDGAQQPFPFTAAPRTYGAFPLGVWGPPQDANNPQIPSGEVVQALSELTLTAAATQAPGGPEIAYYQVEIGPRKPLPFSVQAAQSAAVRTAGADLAELVPAPSSVDAAFATAGRWLADRSSPLELATLRGSRQAPPRFGTLGEGLDTTPVSVVPSVGDVPVVPPVDTFVYPPQAVGLLARAGVARATEPPTGTTVSDAPRARRAPPPTLASVQAARSRSVAAQLLLVDAPATTGGATQTLIATGTSPLTAAARGASAAVSGAGSAGLDRLNGLTASLAAGRRLASAAATPTPGAVLQCGEVAVLRAPNAARDVGDADRPQLGLSGGPVRVVAVANGGQVTDDLDVTGDGPQSWTLPAGSERVAVVALGDGADQEAGLAGWHSGMQLPYLGWSTGIGARCTVRSTGQPIGAHRERGLAGWVTGAELACGLSTVATRFSQPVTVVLVALDDPEALGGDVAGRTLVLGLDGATRTADAVGDALPPVVLVADNRSLLAYQVQPSGDGPVTVTVATQQGWSLAGVFGAVGIGAEAAVAPLAEHGFDAALLPLAPGNGGSVRLFWIDAAAPPTARRPARARATRKPRTASSPRKRGSR